MPRLPRIVIPGLPHHITQRGNRRQQTFFSAEDYQTYLELMHEACDRYRVKLWSYCLIPNHIHLIAVPPTKASLAKAIGRGHESYTRYINFKMKWRGYLWQGRFGSSPMDEEYLLLAARYIELNPVTARLVANPATYPWSSAQAHLGLKPSNFIEVAPMLERVPDWKAFLKEGLSEKVIAMLEESQRTGRPLGSEKFVKELEKVTGLQLLPQERKKPKNP